MTPMQAEQLIALLQIIIHKLDPDLIHTALAGRSWRREFNSRHNRYCIACDDHWDEGGFHLCRDWLLRYNQQEGRYCSDCQKDWDKHSSHTCPDPVNDSK